jgi:Kef-type K+ transport system membrane component KefB
MESDYLILVTLGCLLILSPLVKGILDRLKIPVLVGYIGLGFLISVINHQWAFISTAFDNTFSTLAELGVVALLFHVGLKSHTRALLAKLPDASFIWLGDVLTNLALGFVVSHYALSLPLGTSLVIATAFSATSVAVSVALWDELHMLNTSKGRLLVDVAELDDLSGVLLLAILLAVIPVLNGGDGDIVALVGTTTLMVCLKLVLFITGCYLFAHYLEADFTRFNRAIEDSTTAMTISILGVGITIAAVAGYLGFSLAIGALFAGLAFSRDPEAVRTRAKFSYFYDFFSPFFFIYIGMQLDPAAVSESIGLGILLFAAAAMGKIIGIAVPALRSLPKADAMLLGISMAPRAEIALVVMYQCSQLGDDIVPGNVFAAMVVVSVITSILAPLVLRSRLTKKPNNLS